MGAKGPDSRNTFPNRGNQAESDLTQSTLTSRGRSSEELGLALEELRARGIHFEIFLAEHVLRHLDWSKLFMQLCVCNQALQTGSFPFVSLSDLKRVPAKNTNMSARVMASILRTVWVAKLPEGVYDCA